MKNSANSPLTGLVVETGRHPETNTTFYYDPACGPYALGSDNPLEDLPSSEVMKIAKVLASRFLRCPDQTPYLSDDSTGSLGSWPCVSVRELLNEYPRTVPAVLDAALLNMSRMVNFPSELVEITNVKKWALFAHDGSSAKYILRQLKDLGYVKEMVPEGNPADGTIYFSIEARGWERLADLEGSLGSPRQAFVAMWFSEEMEPIFREGILPAVTDAGFHCTRIDRKEHNNKICDEIIAEIRKSRFLVADFSGNRGGVYFEAGFAYGLALPVIWTVREQDLAGLHFDTRQYNHIPYADGEDLYPRLLQRIRATIPE